MKHTLKDSKDIPSKDVKEIFVEPFKVSDVLDLKFWGVHQDIRYSQYDFSMFPDDKTFGRWHKVKSGKRKMLFAVKCDGFVRGYISLRKIDILEGSAVMGIALDPNLLSVGVGKRALKQFLSIFFEDLGMNLLKLKVSDFNERAKRLYESVGFVFIERNFEKFENQLMNFKLILMYDDFKMKGEFIYTDVSSYNMDLDRYKTLSKDMI